MEGLPEGMTITGHLLQLDPSLFLHPEGLWDRPAFYGPGYTSFNDAGLESEVGELLYGFIRAIQPDNVLETGTHVGIGASYMGLALHDNYKGHLDTLEFLPEIHAQAVKRIQTMGLLDCVSCHLTDARTFVPTIELYDMILLDTEPQTRFGELIRYFPMLKEGGYIFIHDLNRHMHQIPNEEHGFAWPYGVIPHQIKQWVKKDKLRPFHFGNPRGLTGFYKTHSSDFDWKKNE